MLKISKSLNVFTWFSKTALINIFILFCLLMVFLYMIMKIFIMVEIGGYRYCLICLTDVGQSRPTSSVRGSSLATFISPLDTFE